MTRRARGARWSATRSWLTDTLAHDWVRASLSILILPFMTSWADYPANAPTRPETISRFAASQLGFVGVGYLVYVLLTALVFARCSPGEFRRRLTVSMPRTRARRWLQWMSGGGPASLSSQLVISSLLVVLFVALYRPLRTSVPVLIGTGFFVVAAWITMLWTYAVQYARESIANGGLDVPGGEPTAMSDHLYLSQQVQTTMSPGDVIFTSRRMRRIGFTHGLLSFSFNTVVVALLVSVLVST